MSMGSMSKMEGAVGVREAAEMFHEDMKKRGRKKRSMECHRCPHREKLDAGKYTDADFRRTPCRKCELREGSFRTMEVNVERPVFVPGHGAEEVVSYEMFPDEADAPADNKQRDRMRSFLCRFLAMPEDLMAVVHGQYNGRSYSHIARKQKITPAGVEARHRRALREMPELCPLFAGKVARRKMRRRAIGLAAGTKQIAGA